MVNLKSFSLPMLLQGRKGICVGGWESLLLIILVDIWASPSSTKAKWVVHSTSFWMKFKAN